MARIPRILINSITGGTVYHIMSRTALDGFPMKDDADRSTSFDIHNNVFLKHVIGFVAMLQSCFVFV